MKKRWLAALPPLFGALILATTGCGGSKSSSSNSNSSSSSSTSSGSGTFRLGTASGIDSLNPFVAFNQDAYSTFEYIYPVLVQYDSHLHFAPFFAKSWKSSNGGKTWTINTSIKYASGATANVAGLVAHITNASAPNKTTLVVHYKQAAGNVLGQ